MFTNVLSLRGMDFRPKLIFFFFFAGGENTCMHILPSIQFTVLTLYNCRCKHDWWQSKVKLLVGSFILESI